MIMTDKELLDFALAKGRITLERHAEGLAKANAKEVAKAAYKDNMSKMTTAKRLEELERINGLR